MVASAGDLSRWGVLFRGVLWPRFGRILVSALVRPCAAAHCGTVACLVADTAVRTLGIALSCNRPAGARQEPACSSSQCGPRAAARRLGREYPPPCLPAYASHLARGAFKASTEGTGVPQCSQSRATFAPRLFAPEKRGVRLSFVLRALDGSLAGAPHRELAEVLIGQRRVHADWADPRDHLRDRIRRAVSRGRALMNGGYRDFLV
ncbi:DUF2285 domain-containing protein [Mesorhizobium sp. M4B.F.Ca.ET.058.02.1.1]|uniref:DUF2285 domain-containing protein n=1 Tax=Mesorhizobium sp. M4B.F.Ca.ET.058.02.1.1 TaxID=2493675 RepID=UPI001FE1CCD6|nr:DUF2285 domain-containing protein [Mesorhizobium sp. M4B.F.Ca.ET.058.02.1.1]